MIKIMIVDDMPTFREYLESSIDWASYGFEICCEAKDGREALEIFDTYNPDVVLTDITMPYVDGLELAERLLEINPEVAVVFITGNSEFEYARRAVKMGACDYIVKPFDKEELIVSLLKMKDNINKTLEIKQEKDTLLMQTKEELLRKLIYRKNSPMTAKDLLAIHASNLQFASENFLVCAINIEPYENSTKTEDIMKWDEVLFNMLRDMIQIEGSFEMFHDFEGNIITLLNFSTRKDLEEYQGYEFQDLTELVKGRLGFSIHVGISDACYGMEHVREAYYQTLQKIRHVDQGRPEDPFSNLSSKEWEKFYSWDVIDRINHNLDALNYEGIAKTFTEEIDQVHEGDPANTGAMIFISLFSLLLSFLVKKGRNIPDVFGQSFKPYEMLQQAGSYQEKRDLVLEAFERVIRYQSENKDEKSYMVAQHAKDYIHQEYHNTELSIDDISRFLLMNQTYLRKMFKSETGMTLSEYITKYRMEKAKELIQAGEYKISSISEMVGYNDVGYFGKCFKKYFGVSPGNVNINK